MDPKDELINKMGDELLQMTQHLSRLAEKKTVTNLQSEFLEAAIAKVLQCIEPKSYNREGLQETPARVARAYEELFAGYRMKVSDLFKTFDVPHDQMVVVTNIDFVSFCEHHMLPFQGVAHVGYIPNGKVVGLSKLGRVVDVFAKRLQVQERLTNEIVDAITGHLQPKGCACQVTARHMCMACRGVKKENAEMTTSALSGTFLDEPSCRAEFYSIIAQRSKS